MHPDFTGYYERLGEFLSRQVERLGHTLAEPALPPGDADFHCLACELFDLQYRNVAPYRRLCDARGITPAQLTHWSQIPAVPTVAFKEWDWTSLSPEERRHAFHSSGTTAGHPSRHYHDARSLAAYEASLRPWFQRHLLPETTPQQSTSPQRWPMLLLVPPPQRAPHSSLVHMLETIRHALGTNDTACGVQIELDGRWKLDPTRSRAWLEQHTAHNQPVVILATALALAELLSHLAPDPLRLSPGSRVMETGGYKGRTHAIPKQQLRATITRRLGIPPSHIVGEYGMSELSSQAYDHVAGQPEPPGSRRFRFPPWARSIVIRPETDTAAAEGEIGLLRVFDLANVRSALAIQTEDLVVRRGDAFEWVGRAAHSDPRGCSLQHD